MNERNLANGKLYSTVSNQEGLLKALYIPPPVQTNTISISLESIRPRYN